MNLTNLKSLFLSNTVLKCISLLLGFWFWYIASNNHIVTIQLSIPLCFTGLSQHHTIHAPETINVTLRAKRTDIYALSYDSLAIHKNIETLFPGKYGILIEKQDLFLPEQVQLIDYKPSTIIITIEES